MRSMERWMVSASTPMPDGCSAPTVHLEHVIERSIARHLNATEHVIERT